ncbi:DUF305 domain-containing protein [Deinococcus peraridilitoris]|uniref:DUF305 domain-containing protein n=1 Tax=Deinococcus peraridilitoris (strain DSM 19664 / LMG 22246 / CIP 109416 / KR-200) TaxID=937777 RepID=L0A3W7_DEIPD|nr:DUF305 domain-containing protein [Deinococcus peraridilitoris]AFZ68104.1 hypothetical protein Deipe_2639 [Deinococcus peraridilitoris DSM 19664]
MFRLVPVIFLSLTVWAAGQHQHAPPPAAGSPTAQQARHRVFDPQLLAQLETLSGRNFDRAYLSMMIAHHQAGVEMSQALLPRLRDPQVREWAQIVVTGQQGEVREMTAMLTDFQLGGLDRVRADAMKAHMQGMLRAVRASTAPEEAFVSHMLEHHASGVLMATLALMRSDNDLLRLDAQGVVRVQAEQMNTYRSWKPRS